MINRVLIRIKVVQLLYSYLITESSFSIEPMPVQPTREKRFAYDVYVDTLALMARISKKISRRGGDMPLADTPFIRMIGSNELVKHVSILSGDSDYPFLDIESGLAEEIKESALYKRFLKEDQQDSRIWESIFKHIISDNSGYKSSISKMEGYTLRGVDQALELVDKTFSNLYQSSGSPKEASKTLERSLNKSRELYMRLLMLPEALVALRERQLDENRHKYLATTEDLNPNLRFVENKLVNALRCDTLISEYSNMYKVSWLPDDEDLIRRLLKRIMESDIYRNYMEKEGVPTMEEDTEFWRTIFKMVILNDEDFLEYLEDKSVFWNDDLYIIGEFVLKTFKRFAENEGKGRSSVFSMYKDDEDARFGVELFLNVLNNRSRYTELLSESLRDSKWDMSRLAYMDVIIICTALAEILNYPKIPVHASINEYVDIARYYSTPKSSGFVYSILTTIANRLREEGKLKK